MNAVLIGVLIYIAAQLLVGVVVSRKIKDESDYLLAGRSFGLGLATFSVFATWFGAETCISAAGRFYESGLSGGSADPFGYGACVLLMGAVFAIPLWKRKLTTLADLFRERYSVGVERLAVLMMAPTSVLWAAAQIRAFGQVLDASSGVGVNVAIAIAAVVVIVYTVSGGLRADVLTDFVQGIAIVIGLLILIFAIFQNGDEVRTAWNTLDPQKLKFFDGKQSTGWDLLEAWMVPICGSVVAQELVSRILATRTPEIARRASLIGGGFYILIGLIPAFIGLIGASLVPDLKDPEQILPIIAQKHLSTFFYILFAGALVSAILSTVDSTLLAASALVSHNLIVPLKPGMTEKMKVRTARIGVAVAGVIAYCLALGAEKIYDLVESASSFGSAGIFVILVLGLFTKIGGARAAFASLIAGLAIYLWGTYWARWNHTYLFSLAAASLAYFVVSMFEKSSVTMIETKPAG